MGLISKRLENKPTAPSTEPPKDLLEKLLQLQLTRPVLQGKDHWIQSMAFSNFGAGVETTAITIGVLINNLISHPECQGTCKPRSIKRVGKASLPRGYRNYEISRTIYLILMLV
jgi:cytochrome P450